MNGSTDDADSIEAVLARWFPAPAFVRAAAIGGWPLRSDEAALVARAVDRRRREFATGRFLAHEGLRRLGLGNAPIGIGSLMEPLWPIGALGAITHDGDVCAVVVVDSRGDAQDGRHHGLGIDLIHLPQRQGRMANLASLFVADAHERAAIAAFAARLGLGVEVELLLFGLKEAVVKAVSRRVGEFIDLRELQLLVAQDGTASVTLGPRRFAARLWAEATPRYLISAAVTTS